MLNNNQIKTLAEIGKLDISEYQGYVLGVNCSEDNKIKMSYEEFKKAMCLPDMRLAWMLGNNNLLAGGSVLNWIWGEQTNDDYDFFFKDLQALENFELFLKNYFIFSHETKCAKTYVSDDNGLIVQLVGSKYALPTFFGTPEEVIGRFDLGICRFAVDSDYLYTTSCSIRDLISKSLIIYNKNNEIKYNISTIARLFKYSRKGFYRWNSGSGKEF